MREVLGMFTDRESREELGLGQIRDALADALFPGTSTLHTRARYLLFIPWIFGQAAARKAKMAYVQNAEPRLTRALLDNERRENGIIGAQAGSLLKTLPSALYWSALGRYGILTDARLTRERALELDLAATRDAGVDSEGQTTGAWASTIPGPPEGFPESVPSGMALSAEEASWLQERFLLSAPGTLFAHLAEHPPTADSAVPWEDPVALQAGKEARAMLEYARRFSQTMHGAQLLYNFLIAESYEDAGFTRQAGRRDELARDLDEWVATYQDTAPWNGWDVDDFFAQVTLTRGSRVAPGSEHFVREWVEIVRSVGPQRLAQNKRARDAVRNRERRNKGAMARIGNPKRLETWGGSSGAAQYTYRWSYVQTTMRDLHEGLNDGQNDGLTAKAAAVA